MNFLPFKNELGGMSANSTTAFRQFTCLPAQRGQACTHPHPQAFACVLFIDASREYKDAKNQSLLTDEHVQKIVGTDRAFQTVEKYAYCDCATPQEIADNDFNLNIPRYVDTFEEEAEIDLDTVKADITRLESDLASVRVKMQAYLEELGVSNNLNTQNEYYICLLNEKTRFQPSR